MTNYVITGSIGTGKSTVLSILKNKLKDYSFYSIDEEVANLYKDPEITRQLLALFGTCNKAELSQLFFSDNTAKHKIEEIFNEKIAQKLKQILASTSNTITEYPVVFEYGQEGLFDKIIVVTAEEEVRINRVMARNKLTRDQVIAKMRHQLPESVKVSKADFVIENDTNLSELTQKVDALIQGLN